MTIYVMNAQTIGLSTYTSDVDLQGLAVFGAQTLMVGPDGLYEQLGDDDEGLSIVATVETGMISLGADGKKYIPRVNTTLSGDSVTEVWTTIELDGDTIEIGPYELPGRSGPASFVRKWKFAGGIKADSTSLRFEGTDGTAWKLQGLVLDAELV